MRYIIALNHPAHYHLFKHLYRHLTQKGHNVIFVIKDKDILADLLREDNVLFHRLLKKRVGSNVFTILMKGFFDILQHDISLFKFVRKYKPNLMLGTDYSITHIGKIFNIPSIVFNEDDYHINRLFCLLSYPLANCIVSPSVCDVGKFSYKKISYNGYQKLSYLHPEIFFPDENIAKRYVNTSKKYFLIRLVKFSAGHDIEKKHGGISEAVLCQIISKLEKHGDVYITSEDKIPDKFRKYLLQIKVNDIHHVMYFSSLIIADSQSMIVESAMLGIPSIRFNSFVGLISVLNELEDKYHLTIGVKNTDVERLFRTLDELLSTRNLKQLFSQRRQHMIEEKINVSKFFNWFIENYPNSYKSFLKS